MTVSITVLTANHFLCIADGILTRASRDDGRFSNRRDFWALFGISATICSFVWNLCHFPRGTKPKHHLWALLFLKVYGTESALISIVGGPTQKTFKKWVWTVIAEIATKVPSVVSFLLTVRTWHI
jgi:hypothetical protein